MAEPCRWCGDRHGVDQLCQRAERGMTRRSFCFLFGAGVAGALVAPFSVSEDLTQEVIARIGQLTVNSDGSINIYRQSSAGVWRLIDTVQGPGPFTDRIPDALGESTPVTISGYFT